MELPRICCNVGVKDETKKKKKITPKKSERYKTAGVEHTLVLNSNNRLQLHEALLNHA